MPASEWIDVGAAAELAGQAVQSVRARTTRITLTCKAGEFGAIASTCNHVGGPLGDGTLDGDYVVCPWHYWKFHRTQGVGEPGYEADRVPAYPVKVEDGRVLVDVRNPSKRTRSEHPPHPLARPVERAPGPPRVLGIGTTNMDMRHPRYSTSDALLETALAHAGTALGLETHMLRLAELSFRACEGFYSKAARACTWPCSITQMDKKDQMEQVYERFVHWADVVMVATPIRWGAPSSLYYRMVERMNCIQNQETIADRVLIQNKVVGLIITGGQDNVQGVAGQMLGFFAELGCHFPPFPYIAHSRGWSAEDMENNVRAVQRSESLHAGARALVDRAVDLSRSLVSGSIPACARERGGRKAHRAEPAPDAD
ncbi:MAG: NAD(P)H-dependent oxidoreductase [Planctomycetota bacterium]|nr:NAD(P)H-dependent oxidoreductase [Planctomycetota bacterium]